MKEEDRKLWTDRIKDYRASGLTAVKWSEKNDVSVHKLRYYINKFNKEKKLESKQESKEPKWISVVPEKPIVENKSESRAKEIVGIHLIELEKELSNELLSVILVGSLSNNSYTGNAGSDIDLIHILKDEVSDYVRHQVRDIIERTESLTNHDLPIAKCIYRLDEMKRPFRCDFELCLENKDLIELPIEILRIKDSGITIWGEDVIDFIDTPIRDDIIHTKELSILWGKQEKEKNPELYKERMKYVENPTVRIIVQSIIVNAMLDYYFITGKSCSSKKDIGKFMKHNVGNYIFQEFLDLCITYRYFPEQVTLDQEHWMYEQYDDWRKKRRDKEIGDIQHLIRN